MSQEKTMRILPNALVVVVVVAVEVTIIPAADAKKATS